MTTSSRVETIRALLERYDELVDPNIGRNGDKGDGESVPWPPATYTRDVKELERLLRRLRSEERRLWWHLTERYLRTTTTIKERKVSRRVKGKGVINTVERVVWTFYSPRVDQAQVEKALEWLAREWGLKREPMLPVECLVTAPSQDES